MDDVMDRLTQIIEGLIAAGGGTFAITLVSKDKEDEHWVAMAEFGQEAEDSPMVGGASYGMGPSANEAVSTVLTETRWADIS